MTFGSLFAGIGGMDLGLERAGMQCKWQVEIDPFCQEVLKKHWPEVPKYGDIREATGEQLGYVDLIAGGFPCQDISLTGLRGGIRDGNRSGLWADYARLIRDVRPQLILIENVPGLLANQPMRRVLGDISSLGFDAEWHMLPACAFGAPHTRERVFLVAYSKSVERWPGLRCYREEGKDCLLANGNSSFGVGPVDEVAGRFAECPCCGEDWCFWHGKHRFDCGCSDGAWDADEFESAIWWAAEPSVGRVADGVPNRVDRLRGLGNAVVPQVAEWIGRRIVEAYAR